MKTQKPSLAVSIASTDQLKWISEPLGMRDEAASNAYERQCREVRSQTLKYVEELPIKRVYFGNEFCELLIPSHSDVREVQCKAKELGYCFTFVTPPVTDYGIDKIRKLLDNILPSSSEIELVFNDWGVFEMLRTEYPKTALPVAGRLIDKMLRDARLSPADYRSFFSESGLRYIQRSSLSSESYKSFLREIGLLRVEMDFPPQGLQMTKSELPEHVSLYVPFGFVTTGRLCMMRMLPLKEEARFVLDNYHCAKQCRVYDQLMHKRRSFMNTADNTVSLLRKGNTVFYCNTMINAALETGCFDRIVYQPVIPM